MITDLSLRTVTALVAVAGVVVTAWQFVQVQKTEAAQPYLAKKLAWCEEVVEVSSFIATSPTPPEDKLHRFWQMYWGVLGLVEKKELSNAMVEFGKHLDDRDKLGNLSLAIAHACRKELTSEWSAKWAR